MRVVGPFHAAKRPLRGLNTQNCQQGALGSTVSALWCEMLLEFMDGGGFLFCGVVSRVRAARVKRAQAKDVKW